MLSSAEFKHLWILLHGIMSQNILRHPLQSTWLMLKTHPHKNKCCTATIETLSLISSFHDIAITNICINIYSSISLHYQLPQTKILLNIHRFLKDVCQSIWVLTSLSLKCMRRCWNFCDLVSLKKDFCIKKCFVTATIMI